MITIKKTKNNDIGVRLSKNTDMREIYMGVGILLSVLIENNGKTLDETLNIIKELIKENEGNNGK